MMRPCLPAISGIVFPMPICGDPTRRKVPRPIGVARRGGTIAARSLFSDSEAPKLFVMISAEEQSRSPQRRGKLRQILAPLAAFAMYSLRRFLADGCFA